MKANKMSINNSKTKAMMFHTPQRRIQHPFLQIEDSVTEFVGEFNFLGIMINNKHLNWKSHKDMITKKFAKTVGIINRLKITLPFNAHAVTYIQFSRFVSFKFWCNPLRMAMSEYICVKKESHEVSY